MEMKFENYVPFALIGVVMLMMICNQGARLPSLLGKWVRRLQLF